MDKMKHRRLQELDRSDFGIVDGEPDIRGWDVRLQGGQKIGEVEELIIDAQKRKVRYMVVDLDDNELQRKHDKVLIPIGLATLDQHDDDVTLPGITTAQLRELPVYDSDNFDEEVENLTCQALGRSQHTADKQATTGKESTEQRRNARIIEHDDSFYQNDHFNDDNLYRNRLHEAQPASNDSDYQQGLRLWEMRSQGGVIADNGNQPNTDSRQRELTADRRMEMIRSRRQAYEARRGYRQQRDEEQNHEHHRRHRQDNSISARIDREGLRDANP